MDAMGLFQIDEKSGVPIWMQIRKRLVYLITSGKYTCGERLPSVRELSVQLGVNYNTINKVYQDLERDGYMFTKRGKGTYVSEDIDLQMPPVDDEILALASELVEEAAGKGMGLNDVLTVMQEQFIRIVEEKDKH